MLMIKVRLLVVLVISCQEVFTFPGPKPLTPEQIGHLKAWREGKQKMWEISGQYEGDMVLTSNQRNGIIDQASRWKNNEMPYVLDPVFGQQEAQLIHEAVKEFAQKSCFLVRPKTDADVDFVYVTGENTGCWSSVGRDGGQQILNLQRSGCVTYETIVHEFLHAAGFYHQQSASERDNYVTIQWANIQSGAESNFDKYGSEYITSFGENYDYGSIMHYGEYAFTANGGRTIVPLDNSWINRLGIALEMSNIDASKLNKMYNCNREYTNSNI